MAKPLAASGQAHILAWAGDIVPYQITAVFTTPAMIAGKPDLLKHFAAAYQRGVADYRDAFLRLDAAGHPVTDDKTEAAIPLLTKYVFTGDPDARRKILDGRRLLRAAARWTWPMCWTRCAGSRRRAW